MKIQHKLPIQKRTTGSEHCASSRKTFTAVIPIFAPIRHANLRGNAPWKFPTGTRIDEEGRALVPYKL